MTIQSKSRYLRTWKIQEKIVKIIITHLANINRLFIRKHDKIPGRICLLGTAVYVDPRDESK